jgi:hypothetical protein
MGGVFSMLVVNEKYIQNFYKKTARKCTHARSVERLEVNIELFFREIRRDVAN